MRMGRSAQRWRDDCLQASGRRFESCCAHLMTRKDTVHRATDRLVVSDLASLRLPYTTRLVASSRRVDLQGHKIAFFEWPLAKPPHERLVGLHQCPRWSGFRGLVYDYGPRLHRVFRIRGPVVSNAPAADSIAANVHHGTVVAVVICRHAAAQAAAAISWPHWGRPYRIEPWLPRRGRIADMPLPRARTAELAGADHQTHAALLVCSPTRWSPPSWSKCSTARCVSG
jgi:hypothetical protein